MSTYSRLTLLYLSIHAGPEWLEEVNTVSRYLLGAKELLAIAIQRAHFATL
jgi:hypothetical protein